MARKCTSLMQRLDARSMDTSCGCRIWLGATTEEGYGLLGSGGEAGNILAHRAAYLMTHGDIPEGLEPDHLCRVKACINGAHLEAVTHQVNAKRAQALGHNAIKTHCPSGHAYAGANLYLYRGGRYCRECNNAGRRRRRVISPPPA